MTLHKARLVLIVGLTGESEVGVAYNVSTLPRSARYVIAAAASLIHQLRDDRLWPPNIVLISSECARGTDDISARPRLTTRRTSVASARLASPRTPGFSIDDLRAREPTAARTPRH